jgi:hypothetical protein
MNSPSQILHFPPDKDLISRVSSKVWLYGDDGDSISEAIRKYPERVIGVDFFGHLDKVPEASFFENRDLVLYIKDTDELIANYHRLNPRRLMVQLDNRDHLFKSIKLVASMKLVPDLLPQMMTLSREEALNFLDYYLHYGVLEVSVEPFHAILDAMLQHMNLDLWEMSRANPRHFLYVDEQGRVAMSYKDLSEARILGSLDEDPENWKKSEYYNGFTRFFEELPEKHNECTICRFFFVCQAYPVFFGVSCDAWLAVFEEIHRASHEIQSLQEQMSALDMTPEKIEESIRAKEKE